MPTLSLALLPTDLIGRVSQQEFPLVLLERARISAYNLAPEIHLGTFERQGGLQPHCGYWDAQVFRPVWRYAFQR